MPEPNKPSGFDDFDARLAKLKCTRRQHDSEPDAAGQPAMNWGSGLQAGIEIIAGVAGGSLFGWALDRWFDTAPFLIIGGFMLGAAAGMLNAVRSMRRYLGEGDERSGRPPSPD
jgi:ATP synthase protein I